MAELSDADKRILMGENYLEVERMAALKSGLNRSQELAAETRTKRLQYRNSTGVIALIGVVIFVTNYLQLSGPFQPYMSIAAAIGVVGGAACAIWMQMKLQQA